MEELLLSLLPLLLPLLYEQLGERHDSHTGRHRVKDVEGIVSTGLSTRVSSEYPVLLLLSIDK